MKKFVVATFVCVFVLGCGVINPRTILDVVDNVVDNLCRDKAAAKLIANPNALGGKSIEDYCSVAENVTNILDVFMAPKDGKMAASGDSGGRFSVPCVVCQTNAYSMIYGAIEKEKIEDIDGLSSKMKPLFGLKKEECEILIDGIGAKNISDLTDELVIYACKDRC